MDDFKQRIALVTGTSGIARAIALRLASGGAQVVALGIDEASNRALAEQARRSGLDLAVSHADVSEADQVEAT
jgi:meso-butanediol dehydrogenase/(S,S)-butanediol dehydrogenase/diacetyl reductase